MESVLEDNAEILRNAQKYKVNCIFIDGNMKLILSYNRNSQFFELKI